MEEHNGKQALELFPAMLQLVGDPLKDFKKGSYENSFRDYVSRTTEHMDAVENGYQAAEEKDAFLQQLAEEFVTMARKELDHKKKRQQEELLMNYNMCLVTYVNPALIDHNPLSGQLLVDELLRQWKENFPRTNLKSADFAAINAGFKNRFCYITTAVCESQGRGDDCYALNLLRDYRDGYLKQQPDGEELIRQYYDVAPTIVKHINASADSAEVYTKIWDAYLAPCIALIEAHKLQECRALYEDMVHQLTEQYFYTGKVEN